MPSDFVILVIAYLVFLIIIFKSQRGIIMLADEGFARGFYWVKIYVGEPYEEVTVGQFLSEGMYWEIPGSDEGFGINEVEVLKFIGETYVSQSGQ